jgi:4-amino-4-deoxy-L-arabinose transferase-like glycosyltransferase
MEVDAAQYAAISFEMSQTNSFLEVKEFGLDYLDKPPLLFWLSSCFIKLFGPSNFAYKLPSFLFLLGSLFAVYRISILYYTEKIAVNAVLILATTQAFFLITNDVRTDTLLTSCTIISVWLFSEYFEKRKIIHLITASVFLSLGMLSKGPIGAIAVLFPLFIHLLYHKKWRDIFSLKWLFVLIIVVLFLFPMSYGLYTQFDLHPEKGKSGLYFYYWLQSFGRITGENVWNNGLPWHFFLGSSAWDFFPWIIPLYVAIFFKIKTLFTSKNKVPELFSLVGLMAIFAMLSLSKYKLPHYVFVTFPFASILLSEYITNLDFKIWKRWRSMFYIFGIIVLILMLIYQLFFFTQTTIWLLVCIVLQLFILVYFRKSRSQSISELAILVLVLNVFLSFVFYPKLVSFQADSTAAKWAATHIKKEEIYVLEKPSHLYNFYSKNPFTKVLPKTQINTIKTDYWIYLWKEDLSKLQGIKGKITAKKEFVNYPITQLKLNFLLENKRADELEKRYLIKIEN